MQGWCDSPDNGMVCKLEKLEEIDVLFNRTLGGNRFDDEIEIVK